MRVLVLFVSLIFFLEIRAEEKTFFTTGVGSQDCGQYLDDLKNIGNAELVYDSWIQGFISGANIVEAMNQNWNKSNTGADVSFPAIKLLVQNWCKESPTSTVSVAVQAVFYNEL